MLGGLKAWFAGLSMLGKVGVATAGTAGLLISAGTISQPNCEAATTYTQKTETVSIQFETVQTKTPDMMVGETQVTKPGVDGSKKVTYKIGTCNGKQVSKVATKEVALTDPVSQEELVGSKEISTETKDESIPFTTQKVGDPTMDKGTEKTVQTGINGTKKVTYEVVKIDGQEQSRTVKSEEVVTQATPEIIHYGAKVASNCDPNYSPCIPYYSGNALNCADIGIEVRVIGTDHNHFDGDGDGYGCESYR